MRWIFAVTVLLTLVSCLPAYDDLHEDRNDRERYWDRDYERGAFDRSMFEEGAGIRE